MSSVAAVPHEFLVDRDLGKRVVVALRDQGFILHPLPEVYGSEDAAMAAQDDDWIRIAGANGWAALSKNHRISHIIKERTALTVHRVPLFALASGNLGYTDMVRAYILAQPAIMATLDNKPGGGLWAVYRDGKLHHRWPQQVRSSPSH